MGNCYSQCMVCCVESYCLKSIYRNFCCCFHKNISENNDKTSPNSSSSCSCFSKPTEKSMEMTPQNLRSPRNSPSPKLDKKLSFKNLVNYVTNSVKKSKNLENCCKICLNEFKDSNRICHCLKEDIHPTNIEVKKHISENYDANKKLIQDTINIDKNPEKLVQLVNDIYELIDKTPLKDDVTPKTLNKMKNNLVNEICLHLDEFIQEKEVNV
jgi:hypothetical protein